MKFNRRFYNSKINFNSISRKRIVLSIMLGLISAIILYSFFFVLRETDRMLFLDFENRPIVVPEDERRYFNLFFAAISMLMGNSVAINFFFSRPQKIFSYRNNKRNKIINDQNFLGFNFIHWFAKIWFLFAMFASLYMGSAFIENFTIPSVLLIIVLYFDSWKTLIFVLRKKRWKVQIIHLITFLILTFLLSKIDIVNYKSFDEKMLAANPTIEAPSSSYEYDNNRRQGYYDDLVFKMDFNSDGEVAIYNSENEKIPFHEIYRYVEEWITQTPEEYRYRFTPRIRANKNIPLKFIKRFEYELLKSNQTLIIYEVFNDDETTSYYYNNQIRYRLSFSLLDELKNQRDAISPEMSPFWNWSKEQNFQHTIQIAISDKILFDNSEVSIDKLTNEMKKYINVDTLIEYVFYENAKYQKFVDVLSAHKQAVLELRMTEDFHNIDKQYYYNQFNRDEKLNEERRRIMKKYPINITERFN